MVAQLVLGGLLSLPPPETPPVYTPPIIAALSIYSVTVFNYCEESVAIHIVGSRLGEVVARSFLKMETAQPDYDSLLELITYWGKDKKEFKTIELNPRCFKT